MIDGWPARSHHTLRRRFDPGGAHHGGQGVVGPWHLRRDGRLQLDALSYGDYRFSGTILDEAGAIIPGVRIEITASHHQNMTSSSYQRNWKTSSDGAFDVTVERCSSAQLRFLKDGYEPARLFFSSPGDRRDLHAVLKPKPVGHELGGQAATSPTAKFQK